MLLPYRKWKKLEESEGRPDVSYITYTFGRYEYYSNINVILEFFKKFSQLKLTKWKDSSIDIGRSTKIFEVDLEIDDDSDLGLLTSTGASSNIKLEIRIFDVIHYLETRLKVSNDSLIKLISAKDLTFVFEVVNTHLSSDKIYSEVFSEKAVGLALNNDLLRYVDTDSGRSVNLTDAESSYSIFNIGLLEDLIIDATIDPKKINKLSHILSVIISKYFVCVYLRDKVKVDREDISIDEFTESTKYRLEELVSDLEEFDSKSDSEKQSIVKSLIDLQSRLSYTAALKNRVHSRASSDFLLQTFTIISNAGIDLKKWITSTS